MMTDRKIIRGPGFCAVTEDGVLMEYLPDESGDQSGTELLGKVDRMMPGMHCAFVDIGLHENGLIHASQMGVRGMADPSKVLKLHQHIKVTVLSVDLDRNRISLRLLR